MSFPLNEKPFEGAIAGSVFFIPYSKSIKDARDLFAVKGQGLPISLIVLTDSLLSSLKAALSL
jgi:hypothetical protein